MQKVLSSRSRMERVVSDMIFDFSVQPRLSSERGNAMLVASSIYEACKYFTLFQQTPFKGTCALVTSYNPQAQDLTREDTGANTETDKEFIYNTYTELLNDVAEGFQTVATEKSVNVKAHSMSELPVIQGDRDKLYQVLNNLIQNAIKFTPKGGTITAEAQAGPQGFVQICVSDTGCGIAPEELPRSGSRCTGPPIRWPTAPREDDQNLISTKDVPT